MTARWVAVAALLLAGIAQAAPSPDEQGLIAFLDNEYAASYFKLGSHPRRADGNYVWSATFHRELRRPLEKATAHCTSAGGTMQLMISAGSVRTHPGSATVTIASRTFPVNQADLWEWSGRSRSFADAGQFGGFDRVFDQRHISGRTRTVAESNANPPLGLFGCFAPDRSLKWAVSIMPGNYGGNNWLHLLIIPVTADFVTAKRAAGEEEAQQAAKQEQDWRRQQAEQQAAREEHARQENIRLAPWRRSLTIGSETNCGMVTNVRGPLVEVQLPAGIMGPDGIRQFWAKRDDLTDARVPEGCRFGR